DNVVVGRTPWEGPVAPGEHMIVLRGSGLLGTQPVSAPVKPYELTTLTLAAEELDAGLRVEPVPGGARVAIDGVTLGRGIWDGRLRAGSHRVEVLAEGFTPWSRAIELRHGDHEIVVAELTRAPANQGATRGRLVFEADG